MNFTSWAPRRINSMRAAIGHDVSRPSWRCSASWHRRSPCGPRSPRPRPIDRPCPQSLASRCESGAQGSQAPSRAVKAISSAEIPRRSISAPSSRACLQGHTEMAELRATTSIRSPFWSISANLDMEWLGMAWMLLLPTKGQVERQRPVCAVDHTIVRDPEAKCRSNGEKCSPSDSSGST